MSRAQGGTTDLDAYDRYLRARKLSLEGGREASTQAVGLLREAVAIDPKFARAWFAISNALDETLGAALGMSATEAMPLLAEAAEARKRAIALSPNSPTARLVQAGELLSQWKWTEAEAIAGPLAGPALLATQNVENADAYAVLLATTGRVASAVRMSQQMVQLEPLSLSASTGLQQTLEAAGQSGASQQEYERSMDFPGNHQRAHWVALLRMLSREDSDPRKVREQARLVLSDPNLSVPFVGQVVEKSADRQAARLIAQRAFEDPANQSILRMAVIAALADALGDKDLALAALRKTVLEYRFPALIWFLPYSGVRSEPGFKDMLREVGLADYFRSSGNWGDFCRPIGEDDFACR